MIKQNPDILQSYVPSAGSKGSSRTSTVLDQQNNPVQNELRNLQAQDSTNVSRDTTSTKAPIVIPKKKANESEDGYIGKVIGILGGLATVGGLTYLESQAVVNSIAKGAYDLSGPSKAKLTKAIKSLRTQAGKTATEGIKGVSDWFNSLPAQQKSILNNLDAGEIPGTLANTRPGTAAKNLQTIKMLQESAAEASLLNNAEAANALSEAEAERKALRSFNGQKAAAIRWGKPVPTAPKFPSLGGAPAAAKEGNAFMNALREAQLAARETPWINTTMKFMKRMPKFQEGGEPDSIWENIGEWIDPTGISSWDDVRRKFNDPNAAWWEKGLEAAGAIPVFGKIGKAAKAANEWLQSGRPLSQSSISREDLAELHLLTAKPFLYVFNVDAAELNDSELRKKLQELVSPAEAIFLDAKTEAELAELSDEDALELLQSIGLQEPGLATLAHVGFRTLGLQTYLTAGPKEVRAWTIHKGDTAPVAAGVIHTDFQKGFIKAEIVSFADLMDAGSVAEARSKGKVRMEGKDYVMADGDVVEFRFNV